MSYSKANYADGNERADGMYFLRETLDCENLGVTVVDVDAGWSGMDTTTGTAATRRSTTSPTAT